MECSADPVTPSWIPLQCVLITRCDFCFVSRLPKGFLRRRTNAFPWNLMNSSRDVTFHSRSLLAARLIAFLPSVKNTSPANTGDLLEWRVSQQWRFFEAAWLKKHIRETSFHVIKIRVRKNVGDAAGRREETACEDLNTRESADETTQFILQI